MTTAVQTAPGPPILDIPNSEKQISHRTASVPEKVMSEKPSHDQSPLPAPYPQPLDAATPVQHHVPPPQPLAGPSKPTHPSRVLSTHLLTHPDESVKRAMHVQFPKPNPLTRLVRRFAVKHSVIKGMTDKEWKKYDEEAPELMRKAGWKRAGASAEEEGVEISELFWKVSSIAPYTYNKLTNRCTAPFYLLSSEIHFQVSSLQIF